MPNAPQKPTITVHSGNEVTVSTLRLKEQESNGSPVTQCIVEYHIALGSQNWDRLSICLQNRNRKTVDVLVRSLSPNTLYNFRVRMVNDVGESEPSEYTQVITTVTIPGPPTELRASSKRAGKLIKIRWKKPEINPHAVAKYEAQVFNKKSQQWNTFKTVHCTKLSATAKDLETNTKYKFRVFAINSQDQSGDYSEELEAETRCGKGALVAAATGAFIGGTVGGPLLGAAGMGYLAGASASDRSDSTAGKAAAGTAAGIGGGVAGALFGTVGAPLFGGVASYLAYKKLKGKLDDVSPQSSEDEEDEESEFFKSYKAQYKELHDKFYAK